MNKQIEALKMAIEALKDSLTRQDVAINTCEEALAEAENQDDIENQLDYAHARGFKEGAENAYKKMEHPTQKPVALIRHENGNFSPAPSWQSLSDDEKQRFARDWDSRMELVDAIEAKLKEKNKC